MSALTLGRRISLRAAAGILGLRGSEVLAALEARGAAVAEFPTPGGRKRIRVLVEDVESLLEDSRKPSPAAIANRANVVAKLAAERVRSRKSARWSPRTERARPRERPSS